MANYRRPSEAGEPRKRVDCAISHKTGSKLENSTHKGHEHQFIDLDPPGVSLESQPLYVDMSKEGADPNEEARNPNEKLPSNQVTPEPHKNEKCDPVVIDLVTPEKEVPSESGKACHNINARPKQRQETPKKQEPRCIDNAWENLEKSSRKRPRSPEATTEKRRMAISNSFPKNPETLLTENFTQGTSVIMSDGNCRLVEYLQIGDVLLTEDGSTGVVKKIEERWEDAFGIKQRKNHYIHFLDKTRDNPYGLFETTFFAKQVVLLETFQRSAESIRKEKDNQRRAYITTVEDFDTSEGRLIKLAKIVEKVFPSNTSNEVIQEHLSKYRKQADNNRFVRWSCEVGDLKHLCYKTRASTRLLLMPLAFEKPTLLPFLEKTFHKEVSARELEAMAWLIGFWMGDGYRAGAMFALHSEDHEVNGRLEENARIWGMTYTQKPPRPGTFSAYAALHTIQNGIRRWNVGNPFITVLKGLFFYENGKINDAKNVPHFLRTDQLMVREAFLAGLIDSDGTAAIVNGYLYTSITTVYPLIRDGIQFVVRSLGLNISTHIRPSGPVANTPYIRKKQWRFHLSNGSNPDVLRSVLDRCSATRKRNPTEATHKQKKRLQALDEQECFGESNNDIELIEEDDDLFEDRFIREKREANRGENLEEDTDLTLAAEDATAGEDLEEELEEHHAPEEESERTLAVADASVGNTTGKSDVEITKIHSDLNDSDKQLVCYNYSRQFFYSIPLNRKVKVFHITHTSKQRLIPEHQIVTRDSLRESGETKVIDVFNNKCYSCGKGVSNPWKNVPWRENLNCYKLCRSCYDYYIQSRTRCYDCNRVIGFLQFREKVDRKDLTVTKVTPEGKTLTGHKCNHCQGVLVCEGPPKHRFKKKTGPETRECNHCGPTSSIKWHTLPWDKSKYWCHKCGQRFIHTKIMCSNNQCRYVPSQREVEKQNRKGVPLSCSKCQSPLEGKPYW
ncbi:LAFE_0C01750g1_1 [Lachancea fermentati]|uniref:LAFE_0C01750g1_1 n=1 Tax=Lachancea fermentati TaxID=4955 RepID=A0A1G4M927_LACFM|nr:LAFE_0C01750g1_1 [Lachancea fermentati]